MLSNLQLELQSLKEFPSGGGSVMTGSKEGVAAKLREYQSLRSRLDVHSVCHHLALVCADSSNQLNVFERL